MEPITVSEYERQQQSQKNKRQTLKEQRDRQMREFLIESGRKLMSEMDRLAMLYTRQQVRVNRLKDRLKIMNQHAPQFANAGPIETVHYLLLSALLISVLACNFILIYQPSAYLIQLVFGNNAPFGLVIIIPILLLVLELAIAFMRQRVQKGAMRLLNLISVFLIAISPLLILATHLASTFWFSPPDILKTLALMFLAAVTDALIVFGGYSLIEALSFIYFHGVQNSRRVYLFLTQRKLQKIQRDSCRIFRKYREGLDTYHCDPSVLPIAFGPFTLVTARFINQSFGYDVLKAYSSSETSQTGSSPESDDLLIADQSSHLT